jgi:hypothetical protein
LSLLLLSSDTSLEPVKHVLETVVSNVADTLTPIGPG